MDSAARIWVVSSTRQGEVRILPGLSEGSMSVTILVPAALRSCCKGASELSLSASSVRAVLEHLERSEPSLYRSVCDETGKVRRHVNLFVNTSHIRDREGLDTSLVSGDVIMILPAVSGG
jgi:molybdopterin converting factor small subunit